MVCSQAEMHTLQGGTHVVKTNGILDFLAPAVSQVEMHTIEGGHMRSDKKRSPALTGFFLIYTGGDHVVRQT